MKILAIETATEACSAALFDDGAVIHRETMAPQQHAELILPMCDELMAEAGLPRSALDALAFGRGPGSFTGVRIAVGVIQGIAFALDRPVVPVSSLAALAQGAMDSGNRVLAAFDARMGEVYWGAFGADDQGLATAEGPETVTAPEAVPVPEAGRWLGVGSGWASYGETLEERVGERLEAVVAERFPLARHLVRLAARDLTAGAGVAAAEALPVYLRDNVADPRARVNTKGSSPAGG